MRRVVFLLFMAAFLFVNIVSASLGISPAKQEINFVPGESYEFSFIVSSDDPNRKIELYLAGDIPQYATLSKTSIVGAESFKVIINLPEGGITPGKHSIIVRGREQSPENQFIGTRIDIGAPINIFVPYPGQYAELSLNIPTGN